MIKADLHVHTRYSKDSTSSLNKIVEHCLKTGINCLAITDHDTIAGALEMKRIAPFKIIVSEEILTTEGEIIGYFLSEEIPSHLSPEETVRQIKNQGGLVCIPHPIDRFRPHSRLRRNALDKIMPDVDIIEVFNSRTYMSKDSLSALQLAKQHGLPFAAGSDAHIPQEIGRACIELPEFDNAEQFLASLRQGQIHAQKTSAIIHFYNLTNRLRKLIYKVTGHV